jgi:hypothetical protein
MKYTVVWLPSALTMLAELWNDGPDRAAITQAANRIDRNLLVDPLHYGEARADNLRIIIEHRSQYTSLSRSRIAW